MKNLNFKVTDHSDNVSEGSVFFIFKGKKNIGSDFIKEVYEKGCRHFVFKESDLKNYREVFSEFSDKIILEVQNEDICLHQLYAEYCKKFYNDIQKNFKIYGVTGTKGKSSTTFFINDIFKKSGKDIAIISGIQAQIKDKVYEVNLTTPKPDFLWAFFQKAYDEGITDIIIEVSAQALTLKRIFGIEFEGIIFTNFSKDHGEFYPDLKDYFNAKILFLKHLKKNGYVFINSDDEFLKNSILDEVKKQNLNLNLKFFSKFYKKFDYSFLVEKINFENSKFRIYNSKTKIETKFYLPLDSKYSIYNFLSAYSLCDTFLNFSKIESTNLSEKYKNLPIFIPGRGNKFFLKNGVNIYVDLAHSIDSFEKVLKNLRQYTDFLVIIFGCGGEKEPEKRPAYAKISEKYCDKIFITEDNPRNEDLKKINSEILSGFSKLEFVKIIEDREIAIKEAVKICQKNSILAILGKGYERYQIRKNEKIEYSDISSIENNFELI